MLLVSIGRMTGSLPLSRMLIMDSAAPHPTRANGPLLFPTLSMLQARYRGAADCVLELQWFHGATGILAYTKHPTIEYMCSPKAVTVPQIECVEPQKLRMAILQVDMAIEANTMHDIIDSVAQSQLQVPGNNCAKHLWHEVRTGYIWRARLATSTRTSGPEVHAEYPRPPSPACTYDVTRSRTRPGHADNQRMRAGARSTCT